MNEKIDELVKMLDGRYEGNETTKEIERIAMKNNLVIVFGAGDCLCEFRGAIDDEIGCYKGGVVPLDKNGLVLNECSDEYCHYFQELKEQANIITVVWHDDGDYRWTYETTISHKTFDIFDGEELYCKGIVFSLDEV